MIKSFLGNCERFLVRKAPSTQRQYRKIFQEWCDFLYRSNGNPYEATPDDVAAFIDDQSSREGAKSRIDGNKLLCWGTVERKISALRKVYRDLLDRDLVKRNPFDRQEFREYKARENPKRPTEALTRDQAQRLISIPGILTKEAVRDTALLKVLLGGGLRRHEAIALRICDVRQTQRGNLYLYLRATKNGKTAEQAIPGWAQTGVARLFEQRLRDGARDSDPLFTMYVGPEETPTNRAMSVETAYRHFKHYARLAGLDAKRLSPHSCRASAITKLLDDGVQHRLIKEFSRHSSVAMVEKYDKRRCVVDESVALKLAY